MVIRITLLVCCCFAFLNVVRQASADEDVLECVSWTKWFNIDSPLGGDFPYGDSELLSSILDRHLGEVCLIPVKMEVETVDGKPLKSSADTINDITIFDEKEGFKCSNVKRNICEDYKVRFCCPEPTAGTSICVSNDYDCSEDTDEKYCCGDTETKYCCASPCDYEWQKNGDLLAADDKRKLSESCNYCSSYYQDGGDVLVEGFYCNSTIAQYSYCCGSLTDKNCCTDPTNHLAGSTSSSSSSSGSFGVVEVAIVVVIGVGVAIVIIVGFILYLKLFKTKRSTQRRNQTSAIFSISQASSRLRRRLSRNRSGQQQSGEAAAAPFPAPPPTYDEVLAEITDAPPPYSPQEPDDGNRDREGPAPEVPEASRGGGEPVADPGEEVTRVEVNQVAPATPEEVRLGGDEGSGVDQGSGVVLPSVVFVHEVEPTPAPAQMAAPSAPPQDSHKDI